MERLTFTMLRRKEHQNMALLEILYRKAMQKWQFTFTLPMTLTRQGLSAIERKYSETIASLRRSPNLYWRLPEPPTTIRS
jgi:hypothetical protein